MQATFTDEVEAIDKAIAERIGAEKHRIWFRHSTRLNLADETLTITVPNRFIGTWLENHFMADITAAVRGVLRADRKITFAIDPTLAAKTSPRPTTAAVPLRRRRQQVEDARVRRNAVLSHRLKLSLDTFVVGPKNELAYNAAMAVVRADGSPFNPLFVHGGYGVGKTHLLQGLCNAVADERPTVRWLYVSAEDFANQYVMALKTKKLEGFRRRFRQVDLLAIDDVHFLANKAAMQEEFLHTFNTIDLAGKQVVLASDAHPKMIGQLCERLVNRFISGMVVKMEPPDFEMRCRICRQRAQQMKKSIPDAVIRYVAENITGNVRELEGALLKLVAFASLGNDRITLAVARRVLDEHICRTDPIVHISEIESAVGDYFGVTAADIHSPRKDRTVSLARSFCMHLARRFTKMSYPEIGRLMGGKNHATVILANRKIEDLVRRNAQVRWNGPHGNRVAQAKDVLDELIARMS